jgi:hypothetical protein
MPVAAGGELFLLLLFAKPPLTTLFPVLGLLGLLGGDQATFTGAIGLLPTCDDDASFAPAPLTALPAAGDGDVHDHAAAAFAGAAVGGVFLAAGTALLLLLFLLKLLAKPLAKFSGCLVVGIEEELPPPGGNHAAGLTASFFPVAPFTPVDVAGGAGGGDHDHAACFTGEAGLLLLVAGDALLFAKPPAFLVFVVGLLAKEPWF